MIRNRRKEVNETYNFTKIKTKEWYTHFKEKYNQTEENTNIDQARSKDRIHIATEDIKKVIRTIRGRKAAGEDCIHNELLKNDGEALTQELAILTQKVCDNQEIPREMKTSITVPIYKKCDKKKP